MRRPSNRPVAARRPRPCPALVIRTTLHQPCQPAWPETSSAHPFYRAAGAVLLWPYPVRGQPCSRRSAGTGSADPEKARTWDVVRRCSTADPGSGGPITKRARASERTPALLSQLGRHTVSQAPHPRNSLTLADTPNAVGLARLHTADVLSRWGVRSDTVETVQLLVSELATNAVRHPKEGEEESSLFSVRNRVRTFEFTLEVIGDAVRVSVWDRDTRPPVLKEVGVEAVGGRGIFIVAVMSRRWGHYPPRDMPGKVVWAECGLDPVSRIGEDERSTRSPGPPPTAGTARPRAARVDRNMIGRVLVGVRSI
ncbi:ATP-binding protein [Streptomyces scopuliridis]|uniref:ATP-binding protein n=1 Tax=Streptomyces scopuliridis TaxID=452529 RepID=UPI003695AA2A